MIKNKTAILLALGISCAAALGGCGKESASDITEATEVISQKAKETPDFGKALESETDIKLMDFISGTYEFGLFGKIGDEPGKFEISKTGEGTYAISLTSYAGETMFELNQEGIESIDGDIIVLNVPDYKYPKLALKLGYYKVEILNAEDTATTLGTYLKDVSEEEMYAAPYSEAMADSYNEFFSSHVGKYVMEVEAFEMKKGTVIISQEESSDKYKIDVEFPSLRSNDLKGNEIEDFSITSDQVAFVSARSNAMYIVVDRSASHAAPDLCKISLDTNKAGYTDIEKYGNSYFEDNGSVLARLQFTGEAAEESESETGDDTSSGDAVAQANSFFGSIEGMYDDLDSDMHTIEVMKDSASGYYIVGNGFNPIYAKDCVKVTSDGKTTTYFFEKLFMNNIDTYKFVDDGTYVTAYYDGDQVMGKFNKTQPNE